MIADGHGGMGGVPGVINTRKLIADARMAVISINTLILSGSEPTKSGPTSWPMAPPNGLEMDAMAFAVTRDEEVNHMSVKYPTDPSANGCAKPIRIWPTIKSAKIRFAAPTYLSQLPIVTSMPHIKSAGRTELDRESVYATTGDIAVYASSTVVESQLIGPWLEKPKSCVVSVDIAAKESHPHEHMKLRRASVMRPIKRRLNTLYSGIGSSCC